MRLCPATGKEDCQIIDFVDIAGRTPGLVSTPTLFGLDPSELVDGNTNFFPQVEATSDLGIDESLESLQSKKGTVIKFPAEDVEVPSPESVTYVDYDNPFALIGEFSGATLIIHQLSPLAWVCVGSDIYILECLSAGFIRVEPLTDPEGYSSPSLAA